MEKNMENKMETLGPFNGVYRDTVVPLKRYIGIYPQKKR